jgi:hypothetical protein
MSGGDLLFYFTFFILPTVIIVSSIWAYVLLRKGVLLPPRRPETIYEPRARESAPDAAGVPDANITEDTLVAAEGMDDMPPGVTALPPVEELTDSTVEGDLPAAAQDVAVDEEPVEGSGGPIEAAPVPVEPLLADHELPAVDTVVEPNGSVPAGVMAETDPAGASEESGAAGPPAAGEMTSGPVAAPEHDPGAVFETTELPIVVGATAEAQPLKDDQLTEESGENPILPAQDNPRARAPRRKAAPRRAGTDSAKEPVRPLRPAPRRGGRSGRRHEDPVQRADSAADLTLGDDERDVELAGSLSDGNDVHPLGAHRIEDASGHAGSAAHSATDDGDDSDVPVSDDREDPTPG